jgi:hypothetical protein
LNKVLLEILADVYETGIPFHACQKTSWHNSKKTVIMHYFCLSSATQYKWRDEGVAVIANEVTPQALA